MSQLIYKVLHVLCPLLWFAALVEGLPWYRLAYRHLECLTPVLEHLVCQEQHGEVELQPQCLAYIRYAVELLGVLSAEVYRHYVALGLDALRYEGLRPWQVVYLAFYLA